MKKKIVIADGLGYIDSYLNESINSLIEDDYGY